MKLSEYIDRYEKSQESFAKKLNKSQQSVSVYCRGVVPRDVAIKIQRITKGKVTLADLWGIKSA